MGGRGASSGISVNKNEYGTQYTTVFSSGNIKFVSKNSRTSESLLETMTADRIYAVVGGRALLQVIFFDENNKRMKTIDLTHKHKGMIPHTHHGYYHSEKDGAAGGAMLTREEKEIVDNAQRIWYNYIGGR